MVACSRLRIAPATARRCAAMRVSTCSRRRSRSSNSPDDIAVMRSSSEHEGETGSRRSRSSSQSRRATSVTVIAGAGISTVKDHRLPEFTSHTRTHRFLYCPSRLSPHILAPCPCRRIHSCKPGSTRRSIMALPSHLFPQPLIHLLILSLSHLRMRIQRCPCRCQFRQRDRQREHVTLTQSREIAHRVQLLRLQQTLQRAIPARHASMSGLRSMHAPGGRAQFPRDRRDRVVAVDQQRTDHLRLSDLVEGRRQRRLQIST